jgi:cytochrome c peroxidase
MRQIWIVAPAALFLASGVCFAAASEIDQVGQKFSQTTLAVGTGDTVHFVNHDDVTHNINVIDADDNTTDKGLQKPGDTIDQLFDKAGKFTIRCSIHPKMKMTVVVK